MQPWGSPALTLVHVKTFPVVDWVEVFITLSSEWAMCFLSLVLTRKFHLIYIH